MSYEYTDVFIHELGHAFSLPPTLSILSAEGQLVQTNVLYFNLGRIDVSQLANGTYHIVINYRGNTFFAKLVVVK